MQRMAVFACLGLMACGSDFGSSATLKVKGDLNLHEIEVTDVDVSGDMKIEVDDDGFFANYYFNPAVNDGRGFHARLPSMTMDAGKYRLGVGLDFGGHLGRVAGAIQAIFDNPGKRRGSTLVEYPIEGTIERITFTGDSDHPWNYEFTVDGAFDSTVQGRKAAFSYQGKGTYSAHCGEYKKNDPYSIMCGGQSWSSDEAKEWLRRFAANWSAEAWVLGMPACPAELVGAFFEEGAPVKGTEDGAFRCGAGEPVKCVLTRNNAWACGASKTVSAEGCQWETSVLLMGVKGGFTLNGKATGCEREERYCSTAITVSAF